MKFKNRMHVFGNRFTSTVAIKLNYHQDCIKDRWYLCGCFRGIKLNKDIKYPTIWCNAYTNTRRLQLTEWDIN